MSNTYYMIKQYTAFFYFFVCTIIAYQEQTPVSISNNTVYCTNMFGATNKINITYYLDIFTLQY
jgi:hypothetical protein